MFLNLCRKLPSQRVGYRFRNILYGFLSSDLCLQEESKGIEIAEFFHKLDVLILKR